MIQVAQADPNTALDVVNISFGGYLDRSDPEQEVIYQQYIDAVQYARQHGTVIAAARQRVAPHRRPRPGALARHPDLAWQAGGRPVRQLRDARWHPRRGRRGLHRQPGQRLLGELPARLDRHRHRRQRHLQADHRRAPGTRGRPQEPALLPLQLWAADRRGGARRRAQVQPATVGPRWDPQVPLHAGRPDQRLGDFSTTSNWATQIPCFTFSAASGFPENQSYSAIQGTSMATPHVAAAPALLASAHPSAREHVGTLVSMLKAQAVDPGRNFTQVVSATDTSPGDLNGVACPTGFCHLGGATISNRDAYGAGLVNVARP
jgi:hypothetical protein